MLLLNIVMILWGSKLHGSKRLSRMLSNSQASAFRAEHVDFTDDTCIRYGIIDTETMGIYIIYTQRHKSGLFY